MLKQIGTLAREEMERIFGVKIYLDLHVRVQPGWREKAAFLNALDWRTMAGEDDILNLLPHSWPLLLVAGRLPGRRQADHRRHHLGPGPAQTGRRSRRERRRADGRCQGGRGDARAAPWRRSSQKDKAAKLAKKVKGVKQVVNNIDTQREIRGEMIRAAASALVIFALLLSAQDFSEIKFDHLARGLGYTEGPAWSREGYPHLQRHARRPSHEVGARQRDRGLPPERQRPQRQCVRRRGPPVHLRDPHPPRHPHGQEGRDRSAGGALGRQAPQCAQRHRGLARPGTSTSPIPRSASRRTTASSISTASITSRRRAR